SRFALACSASTWANGHERLSYFVRPDVPAPRPGGSRRSCQGDRPRSRLHSPPHHAFARADVFSAGLTARPMATSGKMTSGKMLWFNAEKGFGLICTDEDERLHVARSGFQPGEVPRGRCAGLEVVFDLGLHGENKQAVNVKFARETAPRRARRRQSNRPG